MQRRHKVFPFQPLDLGRSMRIATALALSAGVCSCSGLAESEAVGLDGAQEQSADGGGPSSDARAADSAKPNSGDASRPIDRPGAEVATGPELAPKFLHKTLDLLIGETYTVQLVNGQKAKIQLLEIQETHEPLTN